MKKKTITLTIVLALAALLVGGAVAYAASNVSNIEQKWFEFQKAVTNKMVEDGKLTQEQADERLSNLESKISESEEDIIYNRQGNGKKGSDGMMNKDGRMGGRGPMSGGNPAEAWAEISGNSMEDILQSCRESEKSVWQLAEEAGKLDELKEKVLEDLEAQLNKQVESGRLTEDQKSDILEKAEEHMGEESFSGGKGGGMPSRGRGQRSTDRRPIDADCDNEA